MLKTEEVLNDIRTEILSAIDLKYDWHRETQPSIPRLPYNVWIYIDYGYILSDGNLESKIGTATIRYDGTISFASHL